QAPPNADPDAAGGKADLKGTFTAPTIILDGGGQADEVLIDVTALNGNTFINGGAGDDRFTVNKLPTMTTYQGLVVNGAFAKDANGRELRDELHIDGEDGSDFTLINIEGAVSDYVINVVDTGSKADAMDVLQVEGTAEADVFLMRKNMIANMRRTGPDAYADAFERINYTADINGR